MIPTTSKRIAMRLNERFKQGCSNLVENESGLVVCWFDIVKVLIFLAFVFVCLSPVLDAMYLHIDNSIAANESFYNADDLKFASDIYNLWRFIPLIGFGLVIFYAINYSNWKRDQ